MSTTERNAAGRHSPVMPAGFPKDVVGKPIKHIRREYRIGQVTCYRWLREAGLGHQIPVTPPHLQRKVPADFAEKASRHSDRELRKIYNAGETTIARWHVETGVPPLHRAYAVTKRPVPDDFAEKARSNTITQLCSLYSVSDTVLYRWVKESGVSAKVHTVRQKTLGTGFRPQRDISLVGRAVERLRKYYSNVYSAEVLSPNERKKLPNNGIGMFVVGAKGVLASDAVIALAESKGFDAREWARI